MASILLGGTKFSYQIVRKNIASLRLRLQSRRSFVVSVPRFTPEFVINRFINQNSSWILSHAQKIPPRRSISNLNKLSILGEVFDLIFIPTQSDSVIVYQNEKKIYANISKNTDSYIKKVLEKKLRPLALSLIKNQLLLLKRQFGFDYGRVTVRNQSSRFGSCSSQGNLSFNWQIIFFPPDKFRHLLLHELTHLDIKNHSSKFWHQLTQYDLNAKANNLWLKREGTKLFLF
ncbi:MAG TPA: DUF45 domain-containing protein [Candidatus Woesebacteria bacterium]|jgi:hypothetical protein|nr:DUF45 domain-containing protein [Candidatus Shapirobacteria bacterium]HOR01951.1 DUF45 domain-containing protein [Candidatus Woesebacteria bacterium]HPL01597.1 DUF45 domain-containing protein [bacterium]